MRWPNPKRRPWPRVSWSRGVLPPLVCFSPLFAAFFSTFPIQCSRCTRSPLPPFPLPLYSPPALTTQSNYMQFPVPPLFPQFPTRWISFPLGASHGLVPRSVADHSRTTVTPVVVLVIICFCCRYFLARLLWWYWCVAYPFLVFQSPVVRNDSGFCPWFFLGWGLPWCFTRPVVSVDCALLLFSFSPLPLSSWAGFFFDCRY